MRLASRPAMSIPVTALVAFSWYCPPLSGTIQQPDGAAPAGGTPSGRVLLVGTGRVLLVGTWHGRRGAFGRIQAAIDAARPSD